MFFYILQGILASFFPLYRRLEEELVKERIGDVKVVTASLGADITALPAYTNKKFGGAIMTFGPDMAYLAEVTFGKIKPEKIHTVATFTDKGWYFHL